VLLPLHGKESTFAKALGRDVKGNVSIVMYVASIALAFVQPWVACAGYVLVAAIWFIPDRRFEKRLAEKG
jgi:uncharacterized membrane protein